MYLAMVRDQRPLEGPRSPDGLVTKRESPLQRRLFLVAVSRGARSSLDLMGHSRPWRAVVFDLDDTLYPEREYVASGFRAVAAWAHENLGVAHDETFAELVTLFASGIRGKTFDVWAHKRGMDGRRLVPQLIEIYRSHEPQISAFPGMPQLLERLTAICRVGLVSDGGESVQQRKLRALGLATFLDAVVFSDCLGRDSWKPSRRPFDVVLSRLGVNGEDAVYVGDNPAKDFLGARLAKMSSVRLRHPDGLHWAIEPARPELAPDCEVRSVGELASVFFEQLAQVKTQFD